ncbi:MAG TPA: AHH domain-containing protein [Polyangiaceae bacterium]|nr:AHH domain-containing protein [Polyangiaceae bacterium]
MEIGETVAMDMERALACPMEHVRPATVASQPAKKVKDVDLLKANLAAGNSTILVDVDGSGELVDAGLRPLVPADPSPEAAVVAKHGPLPIRIGELDLPVSVAAHHLIPGKDGLPESQLKRYVWKSEGTISSDIGYHIDGSENGVWLPTHGKLSQRMGKAKKILVPSAGDPTKLVHRSYRFMSKLEEDGGVSFVSAYTQLSMKLFERQYHDSHKEYSNKVVEMLDSISLWLDKASGDACDQCKKSKSPDGKFPPPHFLIFRLNALSARLRGWLLGPPTAWTSGLFTSDYSKQYRLIEEEYQRHLASTSAR